MYIYIYALPLSVTQSRNECLVLWEGYKREEASWISVKDVTAAGLTN